MCEQITLDISATKMDVQTVYSTLRKSIDTVLEKFNFSPLHIVATEITNGLSVRYNVKNSVFAQTETAEDPPGARVICRLTCNTRGTQIELPTNRLKFYDSEQLPLIPTTAANPRWRKIQVTNEKIPALAEAICKDISDYFLSYPWDFGCCSLNKKCSNAGRCIQPNQDMAAGCYYKRNLMCGNIFYREKC